MNKTLIKNIIIAVIIIGLGTGIFFFVKRINRYKKAVEFSYQKVLIIQEFLKTNFPEQVKQWDASVAEKIKEDKK